MTSPVTKSTLSQVERRLQSQIEFNDMQYAILRDAAVKARDRAKELRDELEGLQADIKALTV